MPFTTFVIRRTKKSVLQTMAKNLKVSPGRIEAHLDIVEELPLYLSDGAGGAFRSQLMVELGINAKAAQIKSEDLVDLALSSALGGDGGS